MKLFARPGVLDDALAWAFPSVARPARYALLVLLLSWQVFFIISPSGFDFTYYYLPALAGDKPFFYPYYVKWFIEPIRWLAFPYNYWVWNLVLPLAFITGLRLSKGNPWQFFLSFPFVWVMWYGQLEGYIALGILLCWWASQRGSLFYLGIGITLAMFKPHIGAPVVLLVWLWLPGWRARLRSLWLLGPLVLLSLAIFGVGWPAAWLNTVLSPQFTEAYHNSSLYPHLGWAAMLLWLPAILAPLEKQARFQVVLATTLLTMPYLPPYNHLVLYFWPMPWWQWLLGQVPWLSMYSDAAYQINFLLPLAILARAYYQAFRARQATPNLRAS